jgi:glycerol kinase
MFVGALDQGTTSTRFMVFDAGGSEIARRQIEHRQILPSPGWVEHDPIEIAARVDEVIAGALRTAGLTGRDLAAIGITNQRETTIVWDPRTGRPWPQRDRVAGHAYRRSGEHAHATPDAIDRPDGPASGHVLLVAEAALAA